MIVVSACLAGVACRYDGTAFSCPPLAAMDIAMQNRCELAILKSRSPSCGVGLIYDGSFSGRLVAGDGVFADYLRQAGIPSYTETDCEFLFRGTEAGGE